MSLKLEIGKKYIDEDGCIANIVYKGSKYFVGEFEGGNLFSFHENGESTLGSGFNDLVKEYKEKIKLYILVGIDKSPTRTSWTTTSSTDKAKLDVYAIEYNARFSDTDYVVFETEVEEL